MKRLHGAVVQVEETKRFIRNGNGARLRLALILLDNVIEVMRLIVEKELHRSDTYACTLKRPSEQH